MLKITKIKFHETFWGKKALTFSLNSTRLIRTPHYYKQFALSLGKESPYIFQLIQPAHMDTPLIGKRFMAPSVTGFDCSSDQPLIKTFCSIPSGGVSLTGEDRLP